MLHTQFGLSKNDDPVDLDCRLQLILPSTYRASDLHCGLADGRQEHA
jgi:hypothetical protein